MDPVCTTSTTIFSSSRFQLVRESFSTSVGMVERPVIHHPGAVAIVALLDEQHLVMVRQFRYPVRAWTLEIPAGTREIGELPEVTARRELQEEVGYDCAELHELMQFYPALGVSDERMILYRAHGLRSCVAQPDHGELASRQIVALSEVKKLFAEGAICDAKTLIALSLLGIQVVHG